MGILNLTFTPREKPTRTQVIWFSVIVLVVMIFYLFWFFDARALFPGDVVYKPYSSLDILKVKWSWLRKAVGTVSMLTTIGWAIAVIHELTAYKETERTFYKWYK